MTTSTYRSLPPRAQTKTSAIAAVLLACLFAAQMPAQASEPTMIVVTGDQLYGSGSVWLPEVPLAKWQPFDARLPDTATYVDETTTVTSITGSIITPAAAGVTLPIGRNPEVLFVLTGDGVEVDEPMQITWPNIHDYAPGEVHLIYGYDPRIDQWRVCGAAVVGVAGLALHQFDYTDNVTVSYYFVGEHALVIE